MSSYPTPRVITHALPSMHPARFRRFLRTRFPHKIPKRTKTPPNIAPIEETADPLGKNKKPRTRHTLPRTHKFTGALGKPGCLSCGHDHTVPRNGSGEPARAWSPAWDTVAGGSLQWPPARVMCPVFPDGVPTQRCGLSAAADVPKLENSRYLYEQTRPCSARTSPSIILRHRPPVTRS